MTAHQSSEAVFHADDDHAKRSAMLIRGGRIISFAVDRPDVFEGNVLIENGRITALGKYIDAPHADIVDAQDRIVMPGLVNAHMHTWQTGLRGACADWALPDYLRDMHGKIGPRFTPEDVRLATLAGALNQIACGTTTLGDWCHNNPTPDHTDGAIAGLQESGVRAVFLHGAPKPAPSPGQPHFSQIPHPRDEVRRLASGALSSSDALVTLGMAILGPHFSTSDVALRDLRLAREMGVIASMHQSGSVAIDDGAWGAVEKAGLIGSWMNVVHANKLPLDRLRRLVDGGVSFTSTPEVELSMGHGAPIVDQLLAMGAMPSLGVDVESVVSGEMLTVARFALAQQRASGHARLNEKPSDAHTSASSLQALRWATQGGARALGLDHRVGTLAPGMQADLVLIDTRALNLTPSHDPIASALQASLANIEAVMIGGVWQKRDGKLLYQDLESLKRALRVSGRRLLEPLHADVSEA